MVWVMMDIYSLLEVVNPSYSLAFYLLEIMVELCVPRNKVDFFGYSNQN